MKLLNQRIILAGVTAFSFGLASPAAAQKIHTYGEPPSGPAGVTQGGQIQTQSAPVALDSPEVQTRPSDESTEGDDEGPSEDYSDRVRMASAVDTENTTKNARETLDLAVDKLYRGVIPGLRDTVEHLSKAQTKGENQANRNELTWLGFEPADEYTRVFFQTARKADYAIRRRQNPALIEVTLSNTEMAARNFSRFIDTRFFERNVQRVEASRVDASTLKITIELQNFDQPTVRESKNYIYLDFPAASEGSSNTASTEPTADTQ